MPQLSPIFWMMFPLVSFFILVLFLMEVEGSKKVEFELKNLVKLTKGKWEW